MDNRNKIQIACIDDLAPQNHLVRKIENVMDYGWIYEQVRPYYKPGSNGRPVILIKMVLLLKIMSPNAPTDPFEQMKELISIDTLKAIQLLGFNYKSAIGEPLTQLCANTILSKLKPSNNQPTRK